jgi:hypothetical protein
MLFDNRVKNRAEYSTGSVVLDYSFSTKKDDKFTVRARLTVACLKSVSPMFSTKLLNDVRGI